MALITMKNKINSVFISFRVSGSFSLIRMLGGWSSWHVMQSRKRWWADMMLHLHSQLHRFCLLSTQSHSAHCDLQLSQWDAGLINLAKVLGLDTDSGHNSKWQPANFTWIFNRSVELRCFKLVNVVKYLLFGHVELAANDLSQSQSTFRVRQHGCEAVKSLTRRDHQKASGNANNT